MSEAGFHQFVRHQRRIFLVQSNKGGTAGEFALSSQKTNRNVGVLG